MVSVRFPKRIYRSGGEKRRRGKFKEEGGGGERKREPARKNVSFSSHRIITAISLCVSHSPVFVAFTIRMTTKPSYDGKLFSLSLSVARARLTGPFYRESQGAGRNQKENIKHERERERV